jgi:hypothetical protein
LLFIDYEHITRDIYLYRVGGETMRRVFLLFSILMICTAPVFFMTGCFGSEDDESTVTLIFRSLDSRCEVDAYIGAHPYYGGEHIPGLPANYGEGDVEYVYSGTCPSEGIYIQAIEIGDTVFTTDYYFECRSEPFYVEVDYASTYCDENIIE